MPKKTPQELAMIAEAEGNLERIAGKAAVMRSRTVDLYTDIQSELNCSQRNALMLMLEALGVQCFAVPDACLTLEDALEAVKKGYKSIKDKTAS